jgi:hypothetical protein
MSQYMPLEEDGDGPTGIGGGADEDGDSGVKDAHNPV